MEIRTFWSIVIKGIGLWFLIGALYIIPQLTSSLSIIENEIDFNSLLTIWIINIIVFGGYILIVRLFLFKSEWLINTLKLEKTFSQQKIDIDVSSETVLKIVIIVTGALTFIDGLPHFISILYNFIQQKELIKNYPETSWMVFYFFKTLIGYLVMTNSTTIEKYIHKESKR